MTKQDEDQRPAVCSNTGCFRPAAVRTPRHLCAQCASDPTKNGPMLLGDDAPAVKKPAATK